ncbi:RHS repeat-associated core domain-containing protein [Pseudomonas sp. NPDC089395]|uniref:RHS repeat-associated core domain-containing protein n=1 Tax=Pseudomonas sp. NPDC089395 TaxID=3364460 RepID=UPI0037F5243F
MKTAALAYSPYGYIANQARLVSMLGFNGERYDPLNRLYALGKGYRSYNPALMRFVAPDSLSPFAEGGTNAYAYCAGDPINYVDPTGHAPTVNQLIQARSRLKKPASSATSQKIYLKKNHVGKRSKVNTAPLDTPSSVPETLQLSIPQRRAAKSQGSSILSNPVSREHTYKDRQVYYLFVDKLLNTQAKSEQLFFDLPVTIAYKSQTDIKTTNIELARIRDETNLLRATAARLYPYTDLPIAPRVV